MASAPATRRPDPQQESPPIQFSLDGKVYTLREEELTAKDIRELRNETRLGFAQHVMMMRAGAFDLDTIAALAWMARRQNGEPDLAFSEVEEGITYKTPFEEVVDQGDNDPEASGASSDQ